MYARLQRNTPFAPPLWQTEKPPGVGRTNNVHSTTNASDWPAAGILLYLACAQLRFLFMKVFLAKAYQYLSGVPSFLKQKSRILLFTSSLHCFM